MLKRKIVLWILMLALVLSVIPAFADDTVQNTVIKTEKVLADFSGSAKVFDKTYNGAVELKNAKYDTSFAYDGKKGSLSWVFGSHNGFMAQIPYDAAYTNSYDSFEFRYYTEIPGQKIKLFVNEYNTFNSGADNGTFSTNLVTEKGWNTFSVSMNDIKSKWSVETPEYLYVYFISGWGLTTGTKEEVEAGSKDAIAGEKMYIDSIWLGGANGQKTLADFGIGAEMYDNMKTYISQAFIGTEIADEGKMSSLEWTFTDSSRVILKMPFNDECKTDYDSLVIRYHTEIPGQTFGMGINETDHWGSQSVNSYSIKTIKTTGGWDEYRIPLSEINARWEDAASEYLYISLDSKWFGATAVDRSVFDSTQKQMIIGEKLYVDSIYLEGEEEIIPDPEPEPEPEPEVEAAPEFGKTLATFRTGANVMDRGYPTVEGVLTRATTDTTVAFDGKNSSLSWTFKADNGLLIKIPYSEVWAGNGTFNMRYYAEIPNQKVAVFINDFDTFTSGADKGTWSGTATSGDGWQILSVDLAAIRTKWVAENPDYVYIMLHNNWNATVGTKEEFEAGTKGAIAGEKMYIDSMWVEDGAQVKTVMADFDTGATVKDLKQNKLTAAQTDTSVGYGSVSSSLAWTIGDNGGIVVKLPYDGQWDYFNLKIRYKTEIPGQTFNVAINENESFDSQASDPYFVGHFKTTGEWQESNVEVEYIKKRWQTENPEYIYILLEAKWHGSVAVEKDVFDSTQKQAILGEKVYIDRIWLENKFSVVSFEKNESGTNAVATFDTHKTEPVVLVAAIYEGNKMVDIKTAYSEENVQTLTLDEDLALANGQTAKFMLINSFDVLKPYTDIAK